MPNSLYFIAAFQLIDCCISDNLLLHSQISIAAILHINCFIPYILLHGTSMQKCILYPRSLLKKQDSTFQLVSWLVAFFGITIIVGRAE